MSEMSRPSLPPPAPPHDQHDPLLVAQLVAGDALDEAQLSLARAWFASCPACGSLAADLRLLPAIVAQEPIPRRRRDFRLSPAQAERLSGNAITRALRRLSLPRARAFAPAAGAVMSIGLVFVVAGYAWPEGGSVAVEQELAAAPSASMMVAPSAADAADAAAAAEAGLAADSLAPQARTKSATDENQPAAEASGRLAEEPPEMAESALQNLAADAAPSDGPATTAAMEADGEESMAMVVGPSPVPAATAGSDDVLGADGGAEDTLALSEGSDDLGSLLMVVGAALALGGGALLFLGWLVRRSSDPLLR